MFFQHTSKLLLLLCAVAATLARTVLCESKTSESSHFTSVPVKVLPQKQCANSSGYGLVDFGCPRNWSIECKPSGSICKENNGNKTCDCPDGYFQGFVGTEKQCVEKGGPCMLDEHCSDPNSECELQAEDSGFCRCISGYYQHGSSDEDKTCIKIKEYGQECEIKYSRDECYTPLARCWKGLPEGPLRCLCPVKHYDDIDASGETVCLRKLNFDQECESVKQCLPFDSECIEQGGRKICSCLEGWYRASNSSWDVPACYVQAELGEICYSTSLYDKPCKDTNAQCHYEIGFPYRCLCIGNYYQGVDANNKPLCLEKKDFKRECQSEIECKATNAICKEDSAGGPTVCRCEDNFYESKSEYQNQACIPKKELGDACAADKECKDHNSLCFDGNCTCRASFLQHDGKCYKEAQVGDPCEVTEQCLTPSTQCSESFEDPSSSVCQCQNGLVVPPGQLKCVTGVPIGNECSFHWECLENSQCSVDNVCCCPSNTFLNSNRTSCLRLAVKIGNKCEETKQCTKGKPGTLSNCSIVDLDSPKRCQCTSAAVPDPLEETCLQKAVKVGDPCVADQQCFVNLEESLCYENTCECRSSAVGSTDLSKCLLPVNLDDTCTDHNQCKVVTQNSECLENFSGYKVCDCNQFSVRRNVDCLPLAQHLGDDCIIQSQCRLQNSICDQTCKCFPGYVSNYNGTACLLRVDHLHSSCDEYSKCMVPNSVCMGYPIDPSNTRCQCKPSNFVEDVGQCLEVQTKLNGTCQATAQCSSGINKHAICHDNMCTCSEMSKAYGGKCYSPSGLHHTCATHPECYVGVNENAFCDDASGRCLCKEGFKEDREENKCWPVSVSGKILHNSNFVIMFLIVSFMMLV